MLVLRRASRVAGVHVSGAGCPEPAGDRAGVRHVPAWGAEPPSDDPPAAPLVSVGPAPIRMRHDVPVAWGRDGDARATPAEASRPLHIRWLGRVAYRDAHALQRGLFTSSPDDHLLLLEHPHVYTLGIRGDLGHLLRPPAEVGAELEHTDRGGDVTYHGPGQLVGYPILTVPGKRGGGLADTTAYVCSVEQLVMDVLGDLGLDDVGRVPGFPGVWVAPGSDAPRKICAVGVKLSRGRSMHGFALNVAPDMAMFGHIVPCGIADKGVTSLRDEGIDVSMREVVDAVARRAAERWGSAGHDRADVVWRHTPDDLSPFSRGEGPGDDGDAAARRSGGRLAEAGVTEGLDISSRKPEWMRAKVQLTDDVIAIRKTMRDARPRHRVRGGRLPEPVRVLVGRHRHVHDQRRALHAGVRLLPGRHPPPAAHRPDGARAGGRGRGADGSAVRRRHRRGARRPGRRRRGRVRRRDPGHPGPHARACPSRC